MRDDVEKEGHHFRPRYRHLPGEDTEPSPSERGVFEELELLARTPELRRAWDRVRTAAIRGAAAGVLIKGGLHTLTFIVYLLSRIRGKARQRVTTFADVLRDTVLHTCFLAALGSSYTAVDEGIALVFGKSSTQRWRALLAGLIAGQSLRITGSNRRHYSLATYILLRGLTLLVRTGNKPSAPPALRGLLRPTRLKHGDTLLMCVAASQILYSFIMAPSTLPPTYVRFITRMGAKDPAVWAAIREHAMRNALGLSPGPLRALQGTPLASLNARPGRLRRTPCDFFHPGQSCAGHAASVLPQAYGASFAVYVPFYLVSSVLVHRTALLNRPRELLPKMALAVLRSSAFLSAYIVAAFAGACSGFWLSGTNTGTVIAGSVWAGGLATLLEKKSRRMELAMYCAARALEAFIRCCWLWGADISSAESKNLCHRRKGPQLPPGGRALVAGRGLAPPPPSLRRSAASPVSGAGAGSWRLDVVLFSLGCGAIMHCYSDSCGEHRDVFRSKYLNVLDFIFGNEGVQQGSISHVPTNLELVSNVGRRLRTMSRGVLSSGDYSTYAPSATYSPLPRSAAHSQGDGLSLSSPAGAGGPGGGDLTTSGYSLAPGHGHHGGHGYSRYLQHSQQRYLHLHHPQSGSISGVSGSTLVGRSDSGAVGGSLAAGRASSPSLSSGHPPGKRPMAPTPATPASGPPPSYAPGSISHAGRAASPAHGVPAATVGVAAGSVASGQRECGQEQQRQQHHSPACSGGGSSSGHSSSEWEDVWAAAIGSPPKARMGAAAAAAAAAQAAPPAESPAATVSVPADTVAAAAMPRSSSAPMQEGHAVQRNPFAGPLITSAEDRASAAAAAASPATGALSWAAKLVTGAFQRAAGSASLSSPSAAAAAARLEEERGRDVGTAVSNVIEADGSAGRSGWGFGRISSMRRISTAPHGLRQSARALRLLSDPEAERRGHGRSSYQELQRLSAGGGGGGSLSFFTAAAGGDVPSPASTSSSAAEAAVTLFPPPSPQRVGSRHDSAPSSPLGGRAVPPPRARPVPVPNADSRTPAFRHRSSIVSWRSAAAVAAASSAEPLPPLLASRCSASGSGGSSRSKPDSAPKRLSDGFNIGLVRIGANNSVAAAATTGATTHHRNSSTTESTLAGGGVVATTGASALTFEPRGALSHPSPVPRAPVWPRTSVDLQAESGEGAVCRSAPEAWKSVLAAALAADEDEAAAARRHTAVLHGLEVELEVEAEAGTNAVAEDGEGEGEPTAHLK